MNTYLALPTNIARRNWYFAGSFFLLGCLAYWMARSPVDLMGITLAAALISIAIILSPATGIVLVAAAIPFGRLLAVPLPVGIGLVDVLVGLTLVAWLLQGAAKRRILFEAPPLLWPLLAFVWVGGLSLTQAASWREGITEWLKWAEFAALYVCGTQVLSRRNRVFVIGALFLAGVTQAGIGAYQFMNQTGPEAFIIASRFMRAYGTFQQPNPYAGYLGYLAPLAISLTMTSSKRWWTGHRPIELVATAVLGAAGVALCAGILMSGSRGAWIGLAISAALMIVLSNRRIAAITLSLAVLLILLIAAQGMHWLPASVTTRISDLGSSTIRPGLAQMEITAANFSVLERLAHWQAGIEMFSDHPWLGVGIGNFAAAYSDYAPPHWYEPLGHAHNVFINFLSETGALGLGAFGVFWLGVGWLTWRRAARGDSCQRALALGILGTWIYLSVHSVFDNLFVQHIQLQLALLLAALAPKATQTSLRMH